MSDVRNISHQTTDVYPKDTTGMHTSLNTENSTSVLNTENVTNYTEGMRDNVSEIYEKQQKQYDTGYFWHITDIHLDQNYSINGSDENMCHLMKSSLPTSHNNSSTDNGLFGNPDCDSPEILLLAVTVKSIDSLPHTQNSHADWDAVYETIKNITSYLTAEFPDVPIVTCLEITTRLLPSEPPLGDGGIYRGYLNKGGWNTLTVGSSDLLHFEKGGYYSVKIKEGLRIISLNTVLWYTSNQLTADISDPENQLEWLSKTLQISSRLSEKVYIIGHVPPGFHNRVAGNKKGRAMYHAQHLKSYMNLLLTYSEIIAGQFYGHFHLDMFQVFRYGTEFLQGSAFIAPPINPWHERGLGLPVNPSIRLMHFSLTDFKLLDYDQYYLNLSKANSQNYSNPEVSDNISHSLN
ncbi:acid sphingomyelinase-like phosphodiesterase 3a [Caerostris extrusa]|uniref:Acid sphingomyelinase-like phosphodiesterase 3a n=1 Tax=Caerostris extrusa TaxID=172846 RepID=A0AAV4MDK1_CAEEX|nr:acid sphingomyelinase-like phosphodiesterase 3a [Caerostris extrusa]